MSRQIATEAVRMHHDKDPRKVILDALKAELPHIKAVTAGDCLICVYERPTTKKIKGLNGEDIEIDLSATDRVKEDKLQGCVGLIVKTGPDFSKHRKALAIDPMPAVGDWIYFRRQDGCAFVLGTRMMFLLQGDFIRLVIDDPDCIV